MEIVARLDAADTKRRLDPIEFYEREIGAHPRSDSAWQSALCPFHDERRPSFRWNQESGAWRCFACGTGGDVYALVLVLHGGTFPEAVRYVAERYT